MRHLPDVAFGAVFAWKAAYSRGHRFCVLVDVLDKDGRVVPDEDTDATDGIELTVTIADIRARINRRKLPFSGVS